MKSVLTAIMLITSCSILFAQRDTMFVYPDSLIRDPYMRITKEAFKQFQAKNYLQAARMYEFAFGVDNSKGWPDDRYNAACAWARVGNADSAFYSLFKVVNNERNSAIGRMISSDLLSLTMDEDLESLHNDKRWNQVCGIVKTNKEKKEIGLNKAMVQILDTVYMDDQLYRNMVIKLQQRYGIHSHEVKAMWKTIKQKDSLNLVKIEQLLALHGWPGKDKIGHAHNETIFLVIQHADLQKQRKYLPLVRKAVANKNLNASFLALLEDRIALAEGRKQIYGSQISTDSNGRPYVRPLSDPDNVDKRRALVGLPSLSSYTAGFGLKWDGEAYKQQLPAIEQIEKKRAKRTSDTKNN